MARDRTLPSPLSVLHAKRGTPVVAITVTTVLVSVILLVLLSVSRNLARFERLAASISLGREGIRRFEKLNEVPELAGVARQFDAMVDRLRGSAASIRETAEESGLF